MGWNTLRYDGVMASLFVSQCVVLCTLGPLGNYESRKATDNPLTGKIAVNLGKHVACSPRIRVDLDGVDRIPAIGLKAKRTPTESQTKSNYVDPDWSVGCKDGPICLIEVDRGVLGRRKDMLSVCVLRCVYRMERDWTGWDGV